jgi:DMSO/TMAO reductase YedYZ heme-binding membrane subunit/nitrite reductase/ring-hydroxylating ferredoxin subunit
MSVGYVPVQWNGFKKAYDLAILAGVAAYLASFVAISRLAWGGDHAISIEILMMRALATCALLLLHVVLCIGPLARLNRRFLPLLYNRRHLGVATFAIAALHALLALGYYHGFGYVNPLVSLLMHDAGWRGDSSLPFQLLGAAALLVLFLMAATSHDFWLKNLSPRTWKGLHLLVYPAYGLVVLHVAFGALQSERSLAYPLLLGAGFALVLTLHITAGLRERRVDATRPAISEYESSEWLDAGPAATIADGRARVISPPQGPRIAIFRHGRLFSAVQSICAHQGGPLGEGKIIDGCITCPWHGWQYRPADGQSPPPFTERISTYRVRIHQGCIWVHSSPLPAGTPAEPAVIEEADHVREQQLAASA